MAHQQLDGPLRRIAQGVVQQVVQQLGQQHGVALQQGQGAGHAQTHALRRLGLALAHAAQGRAHHLFRRLPVHAQLQAGALQAGQLQGVVGHAGELAGLVQHGGQQLLALGRGLTLTLIQQ